MLERLKRDVCQANLDLVKAGLVIQTWGNASGIDRQRGLVVIKPSGVPYDGMMPKHMVVVSLQSGKVVEGRLKPSSDTATHLVLYRAMGEIRSDYEANTGQVIIERFRKLDHLQHPAVLVASHGPFAWGKDVTDAVHNAAVLEFVARLASETLRINPKLKPMQSALLDKHFLRKHGTNATYGQT
jgi:ribulose-5-phosphate 4-epimerase/fuculose-1-phosphate aldolase